MITKRVHKRGRSTTEKMLDQYTERMAEILKPIPIPPYEQPKPVRFSNQNRSDIDGLVNDILSVLNGYTIQDIYAASQIVQQYVIAQQGIGMGMYIPPTRSNL
jgi:hypothetical protein